MSSRGLKPLLCRVFLAGLKARFPGLEVRGFHLSSLRSDWDALRRSPYNDALKRAAYDGLLRRSPLH